MYEVKGINGESQPFVAVRFRGGAKNNRFDAKRRSKFGQQLEGTVLIGMKETFMVKGKNFEVLTSFDTMYCDPNVAYFEAATIVMEFLYRDAKTESRVYRLFAKTGLEIFLPRHLTVGQWKESEGTLPAPEWDETYLMVRKLSDADFTAVQTIEVLKNAGLLEWVNEICPTADAVLP
jgi:hypothetical protein